MREEMLVVHLVGLIMGVGTSFSFIFLGIAGSKLEKEERLKFALNTFPLARMGHIGLTLLIISGGYLMTPFWGSFTRPAFTYCQTGTCPNPDCYHHVNCHGHKAGKKG